MLTGMHVHTKKHLTLYTNTEYNKNQFADQNKASEASLVFGDDIFEDIHYNELSQFEHKCVAREKIYVCDMWDKSHYKPLEYLEISHSISDALLIHAEVNFRLSEWKESLSLLHFADCLRSCVEDKYAIQSVQKNLFDEDLVHLRFQMLVTQKSHLDSNIQLFSQRLESIHQDVLSRVIDNRISLPDK